MLKILVWLTIDTEDIEVSLVIIITYFVDFRFIILYSDFRREFLR